jgi:hypothetical protein
MDVTREVSRDERFKLRAKSERRRKMKQQGWLVGWLVVVVAVEMRRAAAYCMYLVHQLSRDGATADKHEMPSN